MSNTTGADATGANATDPDAGTPRLTRATDGRLVAGVARGIAIHIGVDVWWVRLVFIVLAFAGGAGFVAYGALWVLVPLDTADPSTMNSTASKVQGPASTESALLMVLGAAGVAIGALLMASLLGFTIRGLWPLALAGLGAALIWLRADEGQRDRLRSGVGRVAPAQTGWWQLALGVGLVLVGLIAFAVGGVEASQAGALLASVTVVVLGIALVVSPFALRLFRERDAERRARIRSEERAEIAAHVHDSVLQSLALIQRNAGDPQSVARIARAQERDLRRWLYPTPAPIPSSLRISLEEAAAEVEDALGVRVDLVCVGDLQMGEPQVALVQAAREAMSNAGRHSGSDTVAVFAEVTDDAVTVHVRDRGAGFDIDAVPADRMGVRESIVGRVKRYGGDATVTSQPGTGTRVELTMGRQR